jgi:aminopeptidase
MVRSFEENLAQYASLAVRQGAGLQPGQELIVTAEIGDAKFVRLIVTEAYRLGAKHVEVIWSDPEVTLARFREGSDEAIGYVPMWLVEGLTRAYRENAARLGVLSSDPGLLSSIPPEKVAASSRAQGAARKGMSELISTNALNWSLVGAASPGWAKAVFPELPQDEAVAKLWDAIFLTARVYEPDPAAAWEAHCENLTQRMAWLNDLKLDAVHFRGPGTDLRVGLVPGHVWVAGGSTSKHGIPFSPNVPTEEIFTMPHRERVDGIVSSTKPLSLRGQVVDGIEVEFKDGVVVGASARKGEETLKKLLESDEGARRLGEVALVPHSSKVSQSGVLFLNTLYDENAASHIALGSSYGENLAGYEGFSDEERLARGANDSIIHVDWMIGSGEVDVDGILADNTILPLMRGGEWVSGL